MQAVMERSRINKKEKTQRDNIKGNRGSQVNARVRQHEIKKRALNGLACSRTSRDVNFLQSDFRPEYCSSIDSHLAASHNLLARGNERIKGSAD